jgi:hypothetical protein
VTPFIAASAGAAGRTNPPGPPGFAQGGRGAGSTPSTTDSPDRKRRPFLSPVSENRNSARGGDAGARWTLDILRPDEGHHIFPSLHETTCDVEADSRPRVLFNSVKFRKPVAECTAETAVRCGFLERSETVLLLR